MQLSINRIHEILRLTAGLGESGETYIVGLDGLMRSRSRVVGGNDAPTAANSTVTGDEDTQYVFTAANFSYSDIDGDGDPDIALGGAYTLARTTLGQMVIRIALQCNEADAFLIMDDDNSAPRLLSRPGEAIYNDDAGRMEGNSPFQVVWLNDEERELRRRLHETIAKVSDDIARRYTFNTAIAAIMVRRGEADAMICGTEGRFPAHLKHVRDVIGKGGSVIRAITDETGTTWSPRSARPARKPTVFTPGIRRSNS